MIALAKPDHSDNSRDESGLTSFQTLGIFQMMLNPRRRWNVTEDDKANILEKTRELLNSDNLRLQATAVKVMAMLERMNQLDEHKILDKGIPDANGSNDLAAKLSKALEQVRSDENYGRVRRAAMLRHSSEPGTNGHGGQSGQMGNGSPPLAG